MPKDNPTNKSQENSEGLGTESPKLERYFHAMMKANASDLHLKPGAIPHVRIRTAICPTQADPVTASEITEMADQLFSQKQMQFFDEHGNIDVAYELPGSDRFRISAYSQRGQMAMAIRRVSREIPNFETLHLPAILKNISDQQQGLILLSGGSGTGKSTTIAAMIEHINDTRPCHIITIEDPIEYLFVGKKAIISQREIGIDVDNFETALKYLMREDPDVVLIGEMRDKETFTAALQAAETGHLVLGTVHASTASQTVGRILDLIGPENRDIYRQSLANNIRAIICQKLLPSVAKEIDRIPAVEILITNPSVRQLIEEGRELELPEIIKSHEHDGMQTFTTSLLQLIEKDHIDPQVAYDAAPNVDELKMMLKGISSSHSGIIGRT